MHVMFCISMFGIWWLIMVIAVAIQMDERRHLEFEWQMLAIAFLWATPITLIVSGFFHGLLY